MYKGFSTIYSNRDRTTSAQVGTGGGTGTVTKPTVPSKKYSVFDDTLVIIDFINALNIPQGQKPGNPAYGTLIWTFIFDPNLPEVQVQIENEIRRVAALDPRIIINTVTVYPYQNGILIEVELAVSPTNQVTTLQVNFDRNTNTASLA